MSTPEPEDLAEDGKRFTYTANDAHKSLVQYTKKRTTPLLPHGARGAHITPVDRKFLMDEMIRLDIQGVPISKMTVQLGVHPNTLYRWQRTAEYKLKMQRTKKVLVERTTEQAIIHTAGVRAEEAVANIEKLIEQYAESAIHKIAKKMDSENEHIGLKAAIDLADRDPRTSKTKKIQASHVHAFLTPQLLVDAAKAAREIEETAQFGAPVEALEIDAQLLGVEE